MEDTTGKTRLSPLQQLRQKVQIAEVKQTSTPVFSPSQLAWLEQRVKFYTEVPNPARRETSDFIIQQTMWVAGMQMLLGDIKKGSATPQQLTERS